MDRVNLVIEISGGALTCFKKSAGGITSLAIYANELVFSLSLRYTNRTSSDLFPCCLSAAHFLQSSLRQQILQASHGPPNSQPLHAYVQ